MTEIINIVAALQGAKENPWLLVYILVAAVIWVAKNPKILYPLMTKFPRIASVPMFLGAIGIDINGVGKALTLLVKGRLPTDTATQATIYYIDRAIKEEDPK